MIGMLIGGKSVANATDCILRDADGAILGIYECVSDSDDEYDYAVIVSVKDGLTVITPDGRQAEVEEGWKASLCLFAPRGEPMFCFETRLDTVASK